MVNRETGEVTVEAGGQTYTLVMDVNALVTLEAKVSELEKRPVTSVEIIDRVNRGSVTYMRAFIWAALQQHHPAMTLADAGRLIQAAGGVAGFSAQLQALAGTTVPDEQDLKDLGVNGSRPRRAQTKAPRGSGGRSTSTPAALA